MQYNERTVNVKNNCGELCDLLIAITTKFNTYNFHINDPVSAVVAAGTIGFLEGWTNDDDVAEDCEEALDMIRGWVSSNYKEVIS